MTIAQPALNSDHITTATIDDAITRLKSYLYSQQRNDGSWTLLQYKDKNPHGGDTALVTQALLIAGESPNDPRLQKALQFLAQTKMTGTYAVAARAQVWSIAPETYRPHLQQDADWLARACDRKSRFDYVPKLPGAGGNTGGYFDHSVTQYGILGMWAASRRGIATSDRFWRGVIDHFIDAQTADGGWSYTGGMAEAPTGSMTAAGLTCLLIGQEQLHRRANVAPKPMANAIDNAVAWLDKNFMPHRNPNMTAGSAWLLYYLYSIERAALAGGYRQFNGYDWFADGAAVILSYQDANTGAVNADYLPLIDSAYALMFLSRGRDPVWIGKLNAPRLEWNSRPNDVGSLTAWLSDLRERDLHWEIWALDDLVNAEPGQLPPVLWVSGDGPIFWTDDQVEAMRDYLDHGGTLLANPDRGSGRFAQSIRELAARMYPQWPMTEIGEDHLFYNALYPVPKAQPIDTVSNGVRDLIVLLRRDWGYEFQSDPQPGDSMTWKIAANLWTTVTDRGIAPAERLAYRDQHVSQGSRNDRDANTNANVNVNVDANANANGLPDPTITVSQISYHGNWNPEPRLWDVMASRLIDQASIKLRTTNRPIGLLENTQPRDVSLIHLSGIDAVAFEAAQVDAIIAYAKRGGTVLIETVGGRGDFASALSLQIEQQANVTVLPVSRFAGVVNGNADLIGPGGQDASEVNYRRYALAMLGATHRPRLTAMFIDDRPAIVISPEDLTLGALNIPRWGVIGYEPPSAQALLTNLVLQARHTQTQQP